MFTVCTLSSFCSDGKVPDNLLLKRFRVCIEMRASNEGTVPRIYAYYIYILVIKAKGY
jgi:hypothetical protein